MPQRHLVAWIDNRAAMRARSDHEDHARPVSGPDERVLRPAGTMDEVPGLQVPLLAFDQRDALTLEHEKVLLVVLAVVAPAGLPGGEDCDREPELGKRYVAGLGKHARVAEHRA